MFTVSRRVSFTVVLALIVGWGVFFLLFIETSKTLITSDTTSSDLSTPLPAGVKISVQTDRRVYRPGETVLIAVRNDSPVPLWIQQPSSDCPSAWWRIESLGADGETWTPIVQSKTSCTTVGPTDFTSHSLKTDQWVAVVPGPQVGDVMIDAPAGTYRVALPYLRLKKKPTLWPSETALIAGSPQFTIQ